MSTAQAAPKPVAATVATEAAPKPIAAKVEVAATTTAKVATTTTAKVATQTQVKTQAKAAVAVAVAKPVAAKVEAKVEAKVQAKVEATVTASTAKPSFAPKEAKVEDDPFKPTEDASDLETKDEIVPNMEANEMPQEQNLDIETPAPIPDEEGYAEYDENEEPVEDGEPIKA